MGDEEATQLTQGVLDPRRMGHNNSGLSETDVADIICILHPCTPAAFQVVAATAVRWPNNVLQKDAYTGDHLALSPAAVEEQETFILGAHAPNHALDLALRFSALPVNPALGFVFGRNDKICDIVLAHDTHKRVSNMHFCLFVNESGVLMLQDMSTNGTVVDNVLLKGKNPGNAPQTRMLNPGSIIQILSTSQDEVLKFIVRIPGREGYEDEYDRRFSEYRRHVQLAADRQKRPGLPHAGTVGAPMAHSHSVKAPLIHNQYGMHWSGGDKYNVVGMIGKGAFATVYQLATKAEGILYAAKELEKRKFMKNGVLDHKVTNEMDIMKSISHPNIVSFIDYHDHANHLYIIMEFVPCGDLAQTILNNGPLPEQLGKIMASQVLDSLHYLHGKRITHRDIKPDNILIADLSPDHFTIKLSDFGLSKVVPDNDTFLKTFCGTLLYCAPEVFPFYKRKRTSTAPIKRKNIYNQSVDIWSFGAVLWYTLCRKPPFEGVADPTGKGMYDKITNTPLESTDLINQGVSDDAVALLAGMLNTDPAVRPTPAECLNHAWFTDLHLQNVTAGASQLDLAAIAEEDELDVTHADAADFDLGGGDIGSDLDEASIHSDSMNFFDPRQSKRLKSSIHAYRDPASAIDSSPEGQQTIPVIYQQHLRPNAPPAAAQPKLFGEVSESYVAALTAARHAPPNQTRPTQGQPDEGYTTQGGGEAEGEALASPSLLGTESLLRDVHMADSSGHSDSPPAEPTTPDRVNDSKKQSQGRNEATPKPIQQPFDRRLRIPVRASFFYDPNNPETQNVEYASRVSGHDFKTNPSMLIFKDEVSLPTTNGSTTDDDRRDDTEIEHDAAAACARETSFLKPPPRLGHLVSTKDSFVNHTIHLNQKRTSWGRAFGNTCVFPDARETRVPKNGIIIEFHAPGLSRSEEEEPDLTKAANMYAWLATYSSRGLTVNGVQLDPGTQGSPIYGRLYTGDEITVWPIVKGQKGLTFRCEFFHGESKNPRPKDKRFNVHGSTLPTDDRSIKKGKSRA